MSKTNSVTETDLATHSFTHATTAVSDMSFLKHYKCEKPMQWWFFGPVVLAMVMFLLMGTVFERRIEALWRHVLEHRQMVTTQGTDYVEPPEITSSCLHAVKTPSQKTIASCKSTTGNAANTVQMKEMPTAPVDNVANEITGPKKEVSGGQNLKEDTS